MAFPINEGKDEDEVEVDDKNPDRPRVREKEREGVINVEILMPVFGKGRMSHACGSSDFLTMVLIIIDILWENPVNLADARYLQNI